MGRNAMITAVGHYAPPKIMTNHDIEKLVDTNDEWIQERSGIVTRYFVEPGVGSAELGAEAATPYLAKTKGAMVFRRRGTAMMMIPVGLPRSLSRVAPVAVPRPHCPQLVSHCWSSVGS